LQILEELMNAVLVDLDGAVIESRTVIIGSCQHALDCLGVRVPEERDLGWIIGPPSRETFPKLLGPEHDGEEPVRLDRDLYALNGLFDAKVFGGMPEALARLRATQAGCSCARPSPCRSRSRSSSTSASRTARSVMVSYGVMAGPRN
jgi:beta-phosphoglucomutase-like phosphatase (HAD superfamily)